MSKTWLAVAEAVAHEKNLPFEDVVDALEKSLSALVRKQHAPEGQTRVSIDVQTGEAQAFRIWTYVPEVVDDQLERLCSEPEQAGQALETELPPPELTRVGAQVVRQVLFQQLRDALRDHVADSWQTRVGEVVTGVVKRFDKGRTYIDLGEPAEGVLWPKDSIPGERLKVGQRVRAVVAEVDRESKGPPVRLSRTSNEFLAALMANEVPEIHDGSLRIQAVARDPGARAKIAVAPQTGFRGDPIGACIGMRGIRIQSVVNELAGERIDVILWAEQPAEFIIGAMAPAEIEKMVVDEEKKLALVGVGADNLARAIGRQGQNVRLAAALTGWTLEVQTPEAIDAKLEAEREEIVSLFGTAMELDLEIAEILADAGFESIEQIAHAPLEEMLSIDEFDEDIIDEIQSRAQNALLDAALAKEAAPAGSLMSIDDMTPEIEVALVARGILDSEMLAEASVDELEGIPGLGEQTAGKMIMEARKPWFA